ncbi:MAG: cytidylate kinase-like family protein [Clostridia bacterium]|nr:cytidylate kinase-like family protein [Clostridia bacterium]
MKKIITISREFGSGGRTIGKHLAEALGVPCYDSEIIEKVAVESGFAEEYIKDKGEYTHPSLLMGLLSSRTIYNGPTNEDKIWLIQCKVIKELAEKGPCVIVGRCADYILRGRDDVMKVFIFADPEARAKRIVEVYGEKEDAPAKRLREKDKRRAAYYQHYTDMNWGASRNYDVCLNSSFIGVDKCVDILKEIALKAE